MLESAIGANPAFFGIEKSSSIFGKRGQALKDMSWIFGRTAVDQVDCPSSAVSQHRSKVTHA